MRDLATQEIEAVTGGCFYLPFEPGLDDGGPWIIICPPPPLFDYDIAV